MNKIFVNNRILLNKEHDSVLDTFEALHDKHLLIGCRRGGCGKCLIKVLQGEYEVIRDMSQGNIDLKNNIVLACCIKPKTDLKITIL
ncbi:MAG: 2Fe-2S iron-sulfur cluster binding domain-containing protein [Bacilli bacterium]|jgi:ferredoxin|nr:2Fe-2S iron-sulfur cluster binding domain-containing protein [Bacilli bacterium]